MSDFKRCDCGEALPVPEDGEIIKSRCDCGRMWVYNGSDTTVQIPYQAPPKATTFLPQKAPQFGKADVGAHTWKLVVRYPS